MRFLDRPFLALDFEIIVVYLPTVLSAIIAMYVGLRHSD